MFKWFDASVAEKFGTTLAGFFMERIPAAGSNNKAGEAKQREVVEKMGLQIQIFKVNHSLNIYTKAKLANTFKWKLLDASYEPELVDELTKTILLKF